jgi:uncharacterized protein YmfQ (DUF2313 family)
MASRWVANGAAGVSFAGARTVGAVLGADGWANVNFAGGYKFANTWNADGVAGAAFTPLPPPTGSRWNADGFAGAGFVGKAVWPPAAYQPGDRHIRRDGADYTVAFLSLLPQGQAWPRDPGTVACRVYAGLNDYWGTVDGRAADLLEVESDPRLTLELLPDWERNWGLPDPCYAEPFTIDDRHRALVQRMTIEGAQSRQFFVNVAAQIGYAISITEYRPFMVGIDACGDNRVIGDGTVMRDRFGHVILGPRGLPVQAGELSEYPYMLGPPENRYYWTVHVAQPSLKWFRCGSGECGVDPHLRIGVATDLECLLDRWKPAHTQMIFDYSGELPGGPMAGTP